MKKFTSFIWTICLFSGWLQVWWQSRRNLWKILWSKQSFPIDLWYEFWLTSLIWNFVDILMVFNSVFDSKNMYCRLWKWAEHWQHLWLCFWSIELSCSWTSKTPSCSSRMHIIWAIQWLFKDSELLKSCKNNKLILLYLSLRVIS